MKRNVSERCIPKRALAASDHILVAIDSNDADYLVSHAMAQAKKTQARITLVHAIMPMNSVAVESRSVPCIDEAVLEREALRMLGELSGPLESQHIDCKVVARRGFAADVICEEIRRSGATRVIMGTHGRRHLAEFALGSVAKEVLRNADIPVFAVGPHAQRKAGRETPRKILHPVSLVGHYEESVKFAMELARIHGAELHLLHVLRSDFEANSDPGRSLDWAEHAMTTLVASEAKTVPLVQTSATFGNVLREILFAAAVVDADWIVIGVHGTFPFWPLSDNTAYRVLAEANCPVLTIPHNSYREKLLDELPACTPRIS